MSTSSRQTEKKKDWEAWNENVESTIELLGEDFLVKNLNVSHLLMFIPLGEVKKITRRLHHMVSIEGKHEEAAAELLAAIKRSEEPDKWKVFVNALKETSGEDSIILHYLSNPFCADPWLDCPEHRRVIELMRQPMHDSLNLQALLPRMIDDNLISQDHVKKIMAKEERGETAFAQVELIAAMQSHRVEWYRKFVTILYEDENHRALAENIDPDLCREKLQSSEAKRREDQQQSVSASPPGGRPESGQLEALPTGTWGESSPATCGCRCCAQFSEQMVSLLQEVKEIKRLLAQKDSQ